MSSSNSTQDEDKFWDSLAEYKTDRTQKTLNEVKQFESVFNMYRRKVSDVLFSEACEIDNEPGSSIFNNDKFGIGGDDGHDELAHEIIWAGKQAVTDFLACPESALGIARTMSTGGSAGYDSFNKIFYNE